MRVACLVAVVHHEVRRLELVELRRLCVCRLEVGEALAEVVGLVVLAAEDPAPDQPHLGIDRVEDLARVRLGRHRVDVHVGELLHLVEKRVQPVPRAHLVAVLPARARVVEEKGVDAIDRHRLGAARHVRSVQQRVVDVEHELEARRL